MKFPVIMSSIEKVLSDTFSTFKRYFVNSPLGGSQNMSTWLVLGLFSAFFTLRRYYGAKYNKQDCKHVIAKIQMKEKTCAGTLP